MANDFVTWLLKKEQEALAELVELLPGDERGFLEHNWQAWSRRGQQAPGGDWNCWLICAGRGFGKTRAGAEWVRDIAINDPQARIALVGSSLVEARAVMVEGNSGLLRLSPPGYQPEYEPSLRRLIWPNGAMAFLYSAGEPESLRGPQHSHAWCDEIAKWDLAADRAMRCWDNLMMGLRLGLRPRVVATTTPRSVPLLKRLFAETGPEQTAITHGSTYDNADNLPPRFISQMKRQYGQTALGRQELDGELLTDIEGALWTRSLIEACREPLSTEPTVRTVIGVDPPASARGDECGIVVCALTESGAGKVLADASIGGASPERWANAVASAARDWKADRVVAEANQGGQMVESVLRAADCQMPIRLVHASRGKAARAEPVAALYESGRVRHVGQFAKLEDQLCGMMVGGEYQGPGRSPDRADALVWALTELMLGRRAVPRVLQV